VPVLAAIALAGISIGVFLAVTYASLHTGIATMDRPLIRWNVLKEAELMGFDPRVFMGLIFSETEGDPTKFVGDQGRSFGPGQFNVFNEDGSRSATAQQFSYTGDGSDLLHEGIGIHYAAMVFKDKLNSSSGDYRTAIWLYKGRSELGATERDQVVADIARFYGSGVV
jgi:hypothetical protein